MPSQVVNARIRGFICLNAHPGGCAANVSGQVDAVGRVLAQAGGAHARVGDVLVIGSSTGYGLSSLITTVFGYGARAVGVCLERAPQGDKTASAGWYNLAAVHRLARAAGRPVTTFNGDAYSRAIKDQVIQHLKASGARLDSVVYSLASPKRTDPATGVSWTSVLKPLGAPYRSKSISLGSDQITEVELAPASDADVEATRKVMGGEDWELWLSALLEAGVLAPGCRTVAYSYIGPELTYPIYRSGTIGKAKEHLEATARALHARLADQLGGAAYVSVNKAVTTQASSAIPVVPLYISILYQIMKAKGTHEGTAEQIARLYRDHLAPGRMPTLDADGRIRLDDREMDPATQSAVAALWPQITSENLFQLTDYAGFKQEFRALFGFEVPGIDYAQPVETDLAI
ncbi:MAG TPA: enoyl-ACP reductase FabV [Polyangia bacterium]|jgi:enoyl-[acyl-carrier protein] reductase/trans-2-enoyl-CoA reductase (NAD+)|nr:enoyl-ACP reductase FabV [Polyangia bacterium]